MTTTSFEIVFTSEMIFSFQFWNFQAIKWIWTHLNLERSFSIISGKYMFLMAVNRVWFVLDGVFNWYFIDLNKLCSFASFENGFYARNQWMRFHCFRCMLTNFLSLFSLQIVYEFRIRLIYGLLQKNINGTICFFVNTVVKLVNLIFLIYLFRIKRSCFEKYIEYDIVCTVSACFILTHSFP